MTKMQIEWVNARTNRDAQRETARSNRAREAETLRSNLANERETYRSNVAREDENLRSNKAREYETYRHNVAGEIETNRANVAKEGENFRHNVAQEGLESKRIEIDEPVKLAEANLKAAQAAEQRAATKSYSVENRQRDHLFSTTEKWLRLPEIKLDRLLKGSQITLNQAKTGEADSQSFNNISKAVTGIVTLGLTN